MLLQRDRNMKSAFKTFKKFDKDQFEHIENHFLVKIYIFLGTGKLKLFNFSNIRIEYVIQFLFK